MVYFCNGKNPDCCDHPGCYINGGECRRTMKKEFRLTEGDPKFKTELVEGDHIVLTEVDDGTRK